MSQHTVSKHDEDLAIEHGVYLIPTKMGYLGIPHVVAIDKWSGNVIRRDNKIWVISELEKLNIEYTELTV